MRLAIAALAVLVSAVLISPAVAQEEPDAALARQPRSAWGDEGVVAVRRAHDAGDTERLASLAAIEIEDAWYTAEILWIDGGGPVLDAFVAAAAARGEETARLADYVTARDPAARAAAATNVVRLREAIAASDRGEPGPALQELAALPVDDGTVLAIRILRARGNAYWGMRRFNEAAATFEKAALAARAIGDLYHAARSCRGSSHAYENMGRMPDAVRVRELWIVLARGVDDVPLLGGALVALATARELEGNLVEAMALAAEGVALLKKRAPEAPELVNCLVEVGRVHRARAELADGVAVMHEALEIARASNNPNQIGLVLSNLAGLHYDRGDLEAALRISIENGALKKASGDPRLEAMSDSDTGWCRFSLGQWTAGITQLEDAVQVALPTGDLYLIARCRNNLAAALHQMGRHERALQLFTECADTYGAMNVPQGRVDCLISAGNALFRLERFDEALAAYGEAEKISTAMGDAARLVQARGARALVLGERGEFEDSLAIHRALLQAAEDANDVDSVVVARVSAGEMLRRLERNDEALVEFDEAVRLTTDRLSAGRSVLARWGRATVLGALGRHDEALGEARSVAEIQLSQLASLTGEEGAGARQAAERTIGSGIAIAASAGDAGAALEFAEMLRAGALHEALNGRGALAIASIPVALRNAEADIRAKLSAAQKAASDARAAGKLKAVRESAAVVAALETELQSAVEHLRRVAALSAGIVRPEIPAEANLRAALPSGSVLVTFFETRTAWGAIVTTRDGHRLVELGSNEAVGSVIEALLAIDASDAPDAAIAAARNLLIEPLDLPADAGEVLLSTTGNLAYVPPVLLVADRPVACVPSASVYALLRAQERGKADGVVALGDPVYALPKPDTATASLRSGSLRTGQLAALPATRGEVEAVGTLKLLGEDATETGLRALLDQRAGTRLRALHLACHGIVDERQPLFSALALTPDAENDGFLTALEVNRLPLAADLVTLSACETARGKVYRGEGVVGLTSAFLVAGARNVLCSLWKVDDEATRALMTRFYELWNAGGGKGVPIAEALRRAQDHVRSDERWRHPRYWAAWQLWGAGD